MKQVFGDVFAEKGLAQARMTNCVIRVSHHPAKLCFINGPSKG
jgi:hypothetical protein